MDKGQFIESLMKTQRSVVFFRRAEHQGLSLCSTAIQGLINHTLCFLISGLHSAQDHAEVLSDDAKTKKNEEDDKEEEKEKGEEEAQKRGRTEKKGWETKEEGGLEKEGKRVK